MNYDQSVYQPTKVTPLERSLNLVIALLNTPTYMTAEQIRCDVAGYGNKGEAFRQMFERDKKLLISLGVPIRTGISETHYPIEGYRILPEEYALPAISFTAEERSAIALALQLFHEEGYTATRSGLDKIAHTSPLDGLAFGEQIYSDAASRHPQEMANLRALSAAASQGAVVTFFYRTRTSVEAHARRVEPWGVIADDGYWYCLGFDQDRQAARVFRISRITTPVDVTGDTATASRPAGDMRDVFHNHLSAIRRYISATVEVIPGASASLESEARSCQPTDNGTQLLTFEAVNETWLKEEVLSTGDAGWVVSPPELRAEVRATLEIIADRGGDSEGK